MNASEPVLIVGAGPTGMTAALEFARFGIPVRLVEKAGEPATTSRAVGVQARTLELFEQRGLAAGLVANGNPGVAVSSYGGGKHLFRLEFSGLDSRYPYILFVSQAQTEKTLRDALAKRSVRIEWATTLIGFTQTERDGVVAILENRDGRLEKLNCSYLIAAEGAHSNVRDTLGLHLDGKSLPEDYALGDFHIDGDLPDSDLHIFSSEHGFLGMFPLGERRYRMIASNPISQPSADTLPSLSELQQLYDQRSHIPVRLRDLAWSSWFHINSRMITHLRSVRVFFGGDSAHIHSPAGAQGMNTGIQDMINLAWKLALVIRGRARTELLDTYEADRIPVIRQVLGRTEKLTKAMGEESSLFRSVFNHLAPWLVGTDVVQNSSTELMSQLALNYRGSALSEDHAGPGDLKAGDRMPDLSVTMTDPKGRQPPARTTTFALMDPSAFTLFYGGQDAAPVHVEIEEAFHPWRDILHECYVEAANDDAGAFEHVFGSSAFLALVRPDGYLGFVGNEQTLTHLARYLEKWFCGEPLPDGEEERSKELAPGPAE